LMDRANHQCRLDSRVSDRGPALRRRHLTASAIMQSVGIFCFHLAAQSVAGRHARRGAPGPLRPTTSSHLVIRGDSGPSVGHFGKFMLYPANTSQMGWKLSAGRENLPSLFRPPTRGARIRLLCPPRPHSRSHFPILSSFLFRTRSRWRISAHRPRTRPMTRYCPPQRHFRCQPTAKPKLPIIPRRSQSPTPREPSGQLLRPSRR